MNTTICGHEITMLIWACEFQDSPAVHHCRKWRFGETQACEAAATPEKLAELFAEAFRRTGLVVELMSNYYPRDQGSYGMVVTWTSKTVDVRQDEWIAMKLPQARATLKRILLLPEGTTIDDVLKAAEQPT